MKTEKGSLKFLWPGDLFSAFFLAALLFLLIWLGYPLAVLFKTALGRPGAYGSPGAALTAVFQIPGLAASIGHTIFIGLAVTALTVGLAFFLAYVVARTRAGGRRAMGWLAMSPLFVPSIFPAMGLIFLFGGQGPLKFMLGDHSLYGPIGVVLGGVVYCLPHAFVVLSTALAGLDSSLYAAAMTLGAGPARRFFTVTLPAMRHSLISAAIIVFILTITDFGIPKVLAGDYSLLATEIFKQVIGLQNFSAGAALSLILLMPSLLAALLDRWARKKIKPSAKTESFIPEPHFPRDAAAAILGWLALVLPLAALGMVVICSLISFWPYDLSLSLENFYFNDTLYGFKPILNSLAIALGVAGIGTPLIFGAAYALERTSQPAPPRGLFRALAFLPVCVPGTMLGLAYILAFNTPGNVLYGTLSILIINCIIHFYSVAHLAFSGSLAGMDDNFEKAGASLGVSPPTTFLKVIIPVQSPALAQVGFYLFINALTTISAVIFIYSPDTVPASVAILQMFDSGQTGQASALGCLILASALLARLLTGLIVGRSRRKYYRRPSR